eukprot:5599176-Alexandrium_andersonii.AAC.1
MARAAQVPPLSAVVDVQHGVALHNRLGGLEHLVGLRRVVAHAAMEQGVLHGCRRPCRDLGLAEHAVDVLDAGVNRQEGEHGGNEHVGDRPIVKARAAARGAGSAPSAPG